jgi:membrane-bound metal-dependent hydrolase YbcI (DUF457 family)
MFIGHFAVALGAKKAAPRVSLGTTFMAAQFVDLLWPLLLLLGWEHVRINPGNTVVTPFDFYDYPITHSLLGAVLWSCAFGAVLYGIRRSARNALVCAGVVFSHWILDLLTHRPDLPLGFGGNTYFGLGLWNSLIGTIIVEVGLYALGIAFYLQMTKAKDRVGSIGFWSLVGLIGLAYVGNVFGPPPPDVAAIKVAGNATWLFVLWAYWVDKHREAKIVQ